MQETNWRGETVWRKCKCGETAHDAEAVLIVGEDGTCPSGKFVYKCRNCRTPWSFRPLQIRK